MKIEDQIEDQYIYKWCLEGVSNGGVMEEEEQIELSCQIC